MTSNKSTLKNAFAIFASKHLLGAIAILLLPFYAFAASDRTEVLESLAQLSSGINHSEVVVTELRTANIRMLGGTEQGYLAVFSRYKEARLAAVQSIERARLEPTSKNLYNVRADIAEVGGDLNALALWVYLASQGRDNGAAFKENLDKIHSCSSAFKTQIFSYDLAVQGTLQGAR